jgi:tryptophan-rich sensory protein
MFKNLIESFIGKSQDYPYKGTYTIKKNLWYNKLNKSSLTPPNYIFSIVWPILYIMMGTSFYIYISSNNYNTSGIILFIIQLVLNLSWQPIFFKYKMIFESYNIMILLYIILCLTHNNFKAVNIYSSYLLIPYILWINFALYLNFYIVKHNLNQIEQYKLNV